MKEDTESQEGTIDKDKGWNWGMIGILVLVGLVTLVVIAGSMPRHHPADRTQAINNAKQVGLALLEFDQEYGCFPNRETAAKVLKATGTDLDLSGASTNALFRQLIAFGIQSEDIFYCKHPEGIRKPDKDMTPGKALEAGEVGFSYFCGQDTKANPGKTVLAAPMRIGTEMFWGETFGDKAVLLKLDNSVEAPLIRSKDGKVSVGNGKTLFDTGEDTVWGVDGAVDLRHPERGR